jgi:hypothetical protein
MIQEDEWPDHPALTERQNTLDREASAKVGAPRIDHQLWHDMLPRPFGE